MTLGEAVDYSNWSGAFSMPLWTPQNLPLAGTAGWFKADSDERLPRLIRGSSTPMWHYDARRPMSAARPVATTHRDGSGVRTEPMTSTTADCWVNEHGIDLVIPGTQNEHILREQLTATQGHAKQHAYVYLYFAGDPVAQVDEAIRRIQGFHVERLWLDCEDAFAENMTEAATVEFIWRAANACTNRIWSGIYTAGWWWERQTGNYRGFAEAGFPLWHASADRRGDMSPGVTYGGWDGSLPGKFVMEQYRFDEVVCGVNVDRNAYIRELIDPPRPPEPEEPPPPDDNLILRTHLETIRDHAQAALERLGQ